MNRIKILLVAILTTVLLTISVSGTLAWLQDNTDEVKNVFTPTKVKTEIDEPGWEESNHTIKSTVQIKNTGDIPVYVRVAVVGNWVDENNQIVAAWTPAFTVGSDWLKLTDGYYYYTKPLAVDGVTADLLGSDITAANPPVAGAKLVVNVIHQSIQTNPTGVVIDEWGVTLNTSGNITGPVSAN